MWEARYNVEVGSNETTFTTVYPTVTKFGPGITPADKAPEGTQDVFTFADLQYFSKEQRVSFLRYWKAKSLKDMHMWSRDSTASSPGPRGTRTRSCAHR